MCKGRSWLVEGSKTSAREVSFLRLVPLDGRVGDRGQRSRTVQPRREGDRAGRLGGPFYERIHPDDREPTRRAIEKSIAEHTSSEIEYRTTNPSDSSQFKWIKATGWTDDDGAGKPIRFDGITLDVTRRKHADEALRASEETFRSLFLLIPAEVHYWELVRDGSGRIRRGDREAARPDHRLGSTVSFEPSAEVEGVWDRFRIEQVVTNLLTNAMRYGNGKPVSVRLERDGDRAVLSVRDQGIGIAPEAQPRIFVRVGEPPGRGFHVRRGASAETLVARAGPRGRFLDPRG